MSKVTICIEGSVGFVSRQASSAHIRAPGRKTGKSASRCLARCHAPWPFISSLLAFSLFVLLFALGVSADECNMQGYVYYHDGSPVPSGTPVNITNVNTGVTYPVTTGFGWQNFYFKAITCTQVPADAIEVFSFINDNLKGYGEGYAEAQLELNITFINNPPEFNSTLPDVEMDEDNLTGIDNSADLDMYVEDYENHSLTYSIVSQSNPSLAGASIDGQYLDISAPAADQSGSSGVCVRAYDGENYSSSSCFTITINPIQDLPTMSLALANVSGWARGGASVRVDAQASDVDGDDVILYVCSSPSIGPLGCAAGYQRCTSTALSNPGCSFTVESGVADRAWYAYIVDSVSGATASANFSGNYSSDGTAPTPGSVVIESGRTYHNTSSISFDWSGFSDTGSGIQTYLYSYEDGSGTDTGAAVSNETYNASTNGAQEGLNAIYVWAVDSVGNIGDAASDLIIVDTEDPVFSGWSESPTDLRVNHTSDFIVTVTVDDTTLQYSDLPVFRYQLGGGPWTDWTEMVHVSGSGTSGTYSYTISETWNDYEETWLYYEAGFTDIVGHSITEQGTEYIEVENYPPQFIQISSQAGTEDTNMSFTIAAEDIDEQPLIFTSSIEDLTIEQLTDYSANVWWVPSNDYVGDNSVTFYVTDGYATTPATISITVAPVNDPPYLEIIGDLYAYHHAPFVQYFFVTDTDNDNTETVDDDNLTFYDLDGLSWFDVEDRYNVSDGQYYGVLNFTPLNSHHGTHNITVVVSDGDAADQEEILFTVGYCGDTDSGGEPRCDSEYEDCESCPADCGECEAEGLSYMAIITDPRNCFGGNLTFTTYELYGRATCDTQGLIVQGREVCGNLSRVSVKVYLLENRQWKDIDQYISDDDGEVSFVPTATGEYKLEAKKSGYPNTYKYLEINPCISTEVNQTETAELNATRPPAEEKTPDVEGPGPVDVASSAEPQEPASMFSIIFSYVVVPALSIILITLSYYYYEKQKDNVVWILRIRIFVAINGKRAVSWLGNAWQKIKDVLGFG